MNGKKSKYSPEVRKLLDEEEKEHWAECPFATKLIYPSKVVSGIVYLTRSRKAPKRKDVQ